MTSLAVITARGGSKRIPRKNVKTFCGKPIIQYSIEAALQSKIFERVMVSTDDIEIAEIAVSLGAEVPFLRSEENADDFATTTDILFEVIHKYKKIGMEFNTCCCIYPTAPFITSNKIIDSYEILKNEDIDSVLPIVTFSFPPQRGFHVINDFVSFKWPENSMARSQDLEPIYHDCGQFYFFKIQSFLQTGKLVMDKTKGIILSELEFQDIDNEVDWKIAEIKYRLLNNIE